MQITAKNNAKTHKKIARMRCAAIVSGPRPVTRDRNLALEENFVGNPDLEGLGAFDTPGRPHRFVVQAEMLPRDCPRESVDPWGLLYIQDILDRNDTIESPY